MTCRFMLPVTLKIEIKLQKCIRLMGIAIFTIFIWGGISSDIRSEVTFYGSAYASPLNYFFPTVYPTIYLPNEKFEYSYPLSGLSILLHVVISLPDATSYDKTFF